MISTLTPQLDSWRAKIPHGAAADRADDLLAAADQTELAAIRATQATNRTAAYRRHRPTRYTTAAYPMLTPAQDPNRQVSRWLTHGPRTLVLAGPARTGKTTAAYAITNHAHTAGTWVVARTAADLSAGLKPDREPQAYEHAATCDLLLLDDLGRERVTEWWLEQLHRIVDERCANRRRLIVTTNSTAPGHRSHADRAYAELVARYGDPVIERLIDGGGIVVLDGPPVRDIREQW